MNAIEKRIHDRIEELEEDIQNLKSEIFVLESILGDDDEETEEPVKKTRKKTRNKEDTQTNPIPGEKTGFECCGGKNGMHKRTCPVSPSKPTQFAGHECCGSKGPRHKGTCSKRPANKDDNSSLSPIERKVWCIDCDHKQMLSDDKDIYESKCEKCGGSVVQK